MSPTVERIHNGVITMNEETFMKKMGFLLASSGKSEDLISRTWEVGGVFNIKKFLSDICTIKDVSNI